MLRRSRAFAVGFAVFLMYRGDALAASAGGGPPAPDNCIWRPAPHERGELDLACSQRNGVWAVVPVPNGFGPAIVASARAGDAKAMTQMGMFYRQPDRRVHDPAAAMLWLRKAAAMGEPGAMGVIGLIYARGDSSPKNPPEAARWTRMAAEAGSTPAMVLVATFFEQGYGVGKDETQAARWYRAAADRGDAGAMAALSTMYKDGRGVPQDPAESERWWRRAEQARAESPKSSENSDPGRAR